MADEPIGWLARPETDRREALGRPTPADFGHNRQAVSRGVYVPNSPAGEDHYTSNFSSLLLGVTEAEAYCRFPLPFSKGAVVRFQNRSGVRVDKLRVRLAVAGRDLPANCPPPNCDCRSRPT